MIKKMGERIRNLRESRGLGLIEAAKGIGLSRSCLSNIEHGIVTDCKITILCKISIFYNVTIDYLVNGKSAPALGRYPVLSAHFQRLHNNDQDIIMALIISILRKSK